MIQIVNPTPVVDSITLATAVATTSGTAIDFVGIPDTAKRITMMLRNVGTGNQENLLVRLGSTTFQITGYTNIGYLRRINVSDAGGENTTGFPVTTSNAGNVTVVMTLNRISGNNWMQTYNARMGADFISLGAGEVTLSGVLDRVRFTTAAGVNAFNSGLANISWE